jgi:hypothetical protein
MFKHYGSDLYTRLHTGQEEYFNEMHVLRVRMYCEDDDLRSLGINKLV